jgi:hypothetical protein
MPALADSDLVNRLEPETRDAVMTCAAALMVLADKEQRVASVVLMAPVQLGELRLCDRTH